MSDQKSSNNTLQKTTQSFIRGAARVLNQQKPHKAQLLYTPIDIALIEAGRRLKDQELRVRLNDFLITPVPSYFDRPEPFFYLPRFLATPNYETQRALEFAEAFDMPLVIGEDTSTLFASKNDLKRCLAKLPLRKGKAKNGEEIIEYVNIVDFNKYDGHRLSEIMTKQGESLTDFHKNLFKAAKLPNVTVVDEADWVDKNYRQNIFEQYKQNLALRCCFGIMLESFPPEEHTFAEKVVYPAFVEVEKVLGVKPLIVELLTDQDETLRNWDAYPETLYPTIKELVSN